MVGSKYVAAVNGIRNDIAELRKISDVNYRITIQEFDGDGAYSLGGENANIVTHCKGANLETLPSTVFTPAGAYGSTPLFYTVCVTIKDLLDMHPKGHFVILNIFTDGGNTDTIRPYPGASDMQKMIKRGEAQGYTITFQGTKQDTEFAISQLGILRGNTYTHENTGTTILKAASVRSASLSSYSKSVAGGATADSLTDNFYSKSVEKTEQN